MGELYSMVLKLFKTSLPILFLTMIALLWTGCSNRQSPTQDIVELERLCSDYSHAGLFQKNDSVAALLYNYATETGDSMLMAKSLYYLGVYNMIPKTAELRYKRLLHCEKLLQTYPNDTLLLKVYNALGIYEAKYYQRFAKSANYITKSWKMAQKLGDEHKAMVAEQNLSAIMVYLDDTLGLKYDLNIFQYAKEKNDTALLLASAVHCGLYYSSKHFNKEKALYYASFLKARQSLHATQRYLAMSNPHKKTIRKRSNITVCLSQHQTAPTTIRLGITTHSCSIKQEDFKNHSRPQRSRIKFTVRWEVMAKTLPIVCSTQTTTMPWAKKTKPTDG